jgi:purine-cytosine permease-like protein
MLVGNNLTKKIPGLASSIEITASTVSPLIILVCNSSIAGCIHISTILHSIQYFTKFIKIFGYQNFFTFNNFLLIVNYYLIVNRGSEKRSEKRNFDLHNRISATLFSASTFLSTDSLSESAASYPMSLMHCIKSRTPKCWLVTMLVGNNVGW